MTRPASQVVDSLGALDLVDLLEGVLAGVLALLALLLFVVTMRRMTGALVDSRRSRLVQHVRPVLLEVLAAESADPEVTARLATLPERHWRVLEPTLVSMLGKVRGDARGALVGVLARRGTLGRAERGTRSWSSVRRCEAAEMLGATRLHTSVGALVHLLSDRSNEVRRVAARALGRVGAAEAVRPLLGAAVGSRRLSARDAASALVLLEPAATPLIVGVVAESRDRGVRAMAAEVLGLRGAVDATSLLIGMLQDDQPPEVRIRAARALGRIGVRTATGPLAEALESTSGELRAVAARALGQLGSTEGVVPLAECLPDPSHRVAANAAESLAALGEPGLAALRTVAISGAPRAAAYAEEALAMHALGRRSLERAGA